MIAFVLVIALSTISEASPAPKGTTGRNAAILRLRAALPKDWTLELTDLPAGVEAMALGPISKEGRPVLIATRLSDPGAVLDRASLERSLGAKVVSYEPRGVLGATELTAEVTADGTVFVVLHVLGEVVAPYAISLIVPKALFPRVYKTLANAAERLAAEQRKLSEKVGAKR
jgi:hypothetical protein